jgi:hypothetical protein
LLTQLKYENTAQKADSASAMVPSLSINGISRWFERDSDRGETVHTSKDRGSAVEWGVRRGWRSRLSQSIP